MTKRNRFLITYKLGIGILGLSAIVTEIATIVERGRFNPVNFLSYFTIETNILVVATLLLSALAVAAGTNRRLDNLRAAVTVYILIVGLGFSLLLAGLENTQFTAVPWDNIVLHYITPAALLLDFLIDRPQRKLRFIPSLSWLLFPLLYIMYSLVRGAATGWYPYPFLNPSNNGYGAVLLAAGGMTVLALGLTAIVCKLSGTTSPRP